MFSALPIRSICETLKVVEVMWLLLGSDRYSEELCAMLSISSLRLTCLASLSESPESSKGLLLPSEEGEDEEEEEAEVKSLE